MSTGSYFAEDRGPSKCAACGEAWHPGRHCRDAYPTKPPPPQWSDDVHNAAREDEAHLRLALDKLKDKAASIVAEELDRPGVLQEADKIIHGARQEQYGDPERNFERIAKAWSAYLDQELSGHDVCMMMGLLKIIRAHGDYHRDSLVDLAGYAGLAAIAAGDDE